MTYELAKQLKNAGFKFIEEHNEVVLGKRLLDERFMFGGKSYYAPTLSELISAFEYGGFRCLEMLPDEKGWMASAWDGASETADEPETATALLWLKINEDKNETVHSD